jgi:hypothetical protein
MTRTLSVLVLTLSLVAGCTSDPMGLRSSYRDRVVPPSANTQPVSNPPIALQPNVQMGQTFGMGQPVGMSQSIGMGQSVILPQAAISNLALAQGRRPGGPSPYPKFASNGGQIDGRTYPSLSREARMPRQGGTRHKHDVTSHAAIANAVSNTAITGGIAPTPQEDLKYRGGRTIRDLKYMNIYVGGQTAWDATDWKSIDNALASSMADPRLNNVIMQYFGNKTITSQFLGSFFLTGWKPTYVGKNELELQVQNLYKQNAFTGVDFPNTVVNFMLPRGTVLGDPSGGQATTVQNKAIPHEEAEDSTGGLGGYHGSAHIDGKTIYYAVGVYSERKTNGTTNGIPVFDQNWKNVVGTFYHELQEARTDTDVDDAAESTNGMSVLGWTSDSGYEIGDYPIAEATQLLQVFKEIALADGSGTVPIQLQYSNAVHGPEGPIDYPHGMEPPAGTPPPQFPQAPKNPLPSNPPANNTSPTNPSNSGSNLPPEVKNLISNWDQMSDNVKWAIMKLLAP